jgi:hypothetical protein
LVACRDRSALASETKHVINSISTNAFVCFSLARRRERGDSSLPSPAQACTIDTWLILPVVICLSQRLSHACLSITEFIQENCEWLIKSVIVYLIVPTTWITVVILELIHAKKPDFLEGLYLLDTEPMRFGGIVVIHNN